MGTYCCDHPGCPLAPRTSCDACRTPGAVYETKIGPDEIVLKIKLPRRIFGTIEIFDEQRYVKTFHDAILPVMENIYQERWLYFAGRIVSGKRMPKQWSDL